ncbi:HTH domain-containing protein [Halomarina litorea]|uniref:HTH domain-containing protein n=1 Tax=Halomarina litorea TaxID=2961595 RepID=UPI0020C3E72A|nr:HTH domain-containing protein [Halomarina sp. BCD28]
MSHPTPTVEVYVRSLAAGDNQARISDTLSRLADLSAEDVIEGYEVHVWGEGVSLDPEITGTEAGSFIRETAAAFREWAHETGRDLSGFETETTHSAMTGRTHRNLSVPTMAICEKVDDEVTWVAPCTDGDSVHTVSDYVDTLEREGEPAAREELAVRADD